jgi:hypothetical protein
MLKRMWPKPDGSWRKRYVASRHTSIRSHTLMGERPNRLTSSCEPKNASDTNSSTYAPMLAKTMALTAGVIGPGPNTTPPPAGA